MTPNERKVLERRLRLEGETCCADLETLIRRALELRLQKCTHPWEWGNDWLHGNDRSYASAVRAYDEARQWSRELVKIRDALGTLPENFPLGMATTKVRQDITHALDDVIAFFTAAKLARQYAVVQEILAGKDVAQDAAAVVGELADTLDVLPKLRALDHLQLSKKEP